MATTVTEYCTANSNDISTNMKELWARTCREFDDADKMSSPLQGSTFKFLAQLLQPKRSAHFVLTVNPGEHAYADPGVTVLEFGAYTGYSALAWYEGTTATKAQITTLELSPQMAAATRLTLDSYGIGDRVTLIEGPAQESVKRLEGIFDLIFVDANKDGYQGYVQAILDRKLLSPKGLILCDNSKYLHTPKLHGRHGHRLTEETFHRSVCSWHDHLHGEQPDASEQGPPLLD